MLVEAADKINDVLVLPMSGDMKWTHPIFDAQHRQMFLSIPKIVVDFCGTMIALLGKPKSNVS